MSGIRSWKFQLGSFNRRIYRLIIHGSVRWMNISSLMTFSTQCWYWSMVTSSRLLVRLEQALQARWWKCRTYHSRDPGVGLHCPFLQIVEVWSHHKNWSYLKITLSRHIWITMANMKSSWDQWRITCNIIMVIKFNEGWP